MSKIVINNLLDLVSQIHSKYDEISRITGRNFNMFDILGLSKNEVRLHSNIIAELLSPTGSHGQGTLYLNLFLNVLNEKKKSNQNGNDNSVVSLDTKTTKVSVELHIGKQTEEEGGRLDIICQDRNSNKIIIENKIHAPDQINQLLRYHNYDKNATLIYLNLYGGEPTELSLGNKIKSEIKLIILSYETDITKWLELCLKESYQLPVIRETIFQYLNTIKKMTNQIEIRDMDNDIVNLLIGNREKISSAILIEKSVKDAKKTLLLRFGEQLSLLLTKKYGKKAEIELNKSFGDKYAGIKVYSNNTKEVFFQISFLSENREFYLEIFNEDNIEEGVLKKIKNESNINYYKDKLNLRCRPLGQIQNVTSAWLGDWVCRYSKLDSYFSDGNGWGDLADKNYEMANTVLDEISPIIDAMIDRIGSK